MVSVDAGEWIYLVENISRIRRDSQIKKGQTFNDCKNGNSHTLD